MDPSSVASFLAKHLPIDSRPSNRIMAPTVQSRKFGVADYIRKWVFELAGATDGQVHEPSDHRRGDYPEALIGHRAARARALLASSAFAGPGRAGVQ